VRHDRAIQGGNCVRPYVAAKQGKYHRICSGVACSQRYVIAFAGARFRTKLF
jgi:hypothetical protein